MLDELLLISGNDIPFIQAKVNIHQPSMNEIAYINEENFHIGCGLLTFSRDNLNSEDQQATEGKSDFEVLLEILNDRSTNPDSKKSRICALMVLTILFPNYTIKINTYNIALIPLDKEKDDLGTRLITQSNFDSFKEILEQIFCMSKKTFSYNPKGDRAAEIADKFKKRHEKLAQLKGNQHIEKVSIYSRYISILAVGEQKDINALMNYTVYQLNDEFRRFSLREDFDLMTRAKLAGAKSESLDKIENWMKDIHD